LRLRTQILIILLVFGLIPLLAAVMINLPLVLGSLELFYQKAHLQNLRADFRDLDQHLASRQEMVRLLAKLPEPGALLTEDDDAERVDLARARYTQWINQILYDQQDIFQILFLDDFGQQRFWLERDPETRQWRPTMRMPEAPPADFVRTVPRMEPGGVLVSRIRLSPELGATDPRRLMNLYLISPVLNPTEAQQGPMGSVVIAIDVGGIAKFYRNTLWVNNNGSYLRTDGAADDRPRAFEDFPGLEQIFSRGKLGLWEGPRGERIMWVPLFFTENSGPLWVGRQVDPSPLDKFRNALTARVLAIILVLVFMVMLMARWAAVRLERFGERLTSGIGRMLKEDEAVTFEWKGPRELVELGRDLTALAQTHAKHARSLREHAQELEETNRYKSEFLANVSHELRTPLNSILLLSKMLADPDSELRPEQAKQAQVIHRASKDLQNLISDILDHSKIEARETSLELEWFDPRALVERLMELVQPQFLEKGLYQRLETAAEAPKRIRSDPDKLSQILKNFLSNAVKFTAAGGVVIRLEAASQAGCPLAIRVSDTGIGIPESKQQLVFEAFKQADGSTSRRYGGTGLGLSISRELAHLLGGFIELQSSPGGGSTFSLLLPLDPEQQQTSQDPKIPPTKAKESDPSPEEPPTADFAGHGVLLVERDVDTLLLLTPLLEGWGFKVTAAADREETLESLQEDEPCSLVLLDAGMPDDEGCATIELVRAERRYDQLPIVAISDSGDETNANRCLEAGAAELLVRPIDSRRLKEVLDRHLTDTHKGEDTPHNP